MKIISYFSSSLRLSLSALVLLSPLVGFCADSPSTVDFSSIILKCLSPLADSLSALFSSWFPFLVKIACAVLGLWLGRNVFVLVKQYFFMASIPDDGLASGGVDDLDEVDGEFPELQSDGLYHYHDDDYGDMVFEDLGDWDDFVHQESSDDWEDYLEWYQSTFNQV